VRRHLTTLSVPTASRPPDAATRAARRATGVAALLTLLAVTGMQSASADSAGRSPATAAPGRQAWVQLDSSSPLPVDVAVAAWSRSRSDTTVSLGACSGSHCITLSLVDVSACDSETASLGAIGGCAVPGPDGSCTAQVKSWLLPYADALRASVEHEIGHCLGLPHNTTDKRSIMSPVISLGNPPSGPDSTDLSNLSKVTW
jgi:hypothetical protein